MEDTDKQKWAEVQLTKEQAIALFDSEVYKKWTHEQIFRFQLFQEKLCIPFDIFHQASEKVLRRPVYTHEFAYRDKMVLEYLGEREAPTLREIIDLFPVGEIILVNTNEQ